MPLQNGLLIAVKDGVVELTANLVEPHRDDPAAFGDALQQRLADHQYQAMTDDSIIGDDLALASCIVCRDPIPDPLKEPLVSTGFTPQETPGGGQAPRSMFGRLGSSKQRARLEKWIVRYARSAELDPTLAAFESALIEDLPAGALPDVCEVGAALVADAARTYFRLLVAPGLDGLHTLERHIDGLRRQRRVRWVLHPLAVRALAAFTTLCITAEAPDSEWSDNVDEDDPLWVRARGGHRVATDPEYRVVQFVRRGLRASLTDYVRDVVGQAENR